MLFRSILGGIQIPGYMMWVAIAYALVGSWLTYAIGKPLARINFEQERYNADFRYRLIGSDIAASTTGIAGPTGGTTRKPVGLVYISIATPTWLEAFEFHFEGDRARVIEQSVQQALALLLEAANRIVTNR